MPPPLRGLALFPSTSYTKQIFRSPQSRLFSITSHRDQRITRARRALFRWLGSNGAAFLHPLSGSTNYLPAYNAQGQLRRVAEAEARGTKQAEKKSRSGEEPVPDDQDPKNKELPPETTRDLRVFPHNSQFISQPVLSEEFREAIWERIMKEGQSVREVSAQLRVEMSRVAAVVRLKEIEKEWQRIGKPLAKPYNEAVMSMLPKTLYEENTGNLTHESINDLPVHAATGQQIFHPTSESRHFTRADAAKVFDEHLLPADDRVPHPELALMHKDFKAGMTREEIEQRQQDRDEKEAKKKASIAAKRAAKMGAVKAVQTTRWEFRITDINVDDIGKDGRGPIGVGWRYGVPFMDRSKGQVRIPTRVQ